MACELYEEGRLVRCRAVQDTLTPSHHERELYCRTDGAARCPTYRLYRLRRRPISQEAYYALWIPPSPTAPGEQSEPAFADAGLVEQVVGL